MLPKKNRLTSREDFADLKTAGRKYQSNSFALLYKENNLDFSRFGFIVSKRVSLKATQRNLIRRRLSEAILKKIPSLSDHFDFLFLTKNEILGKSLPEIENEITDLFRRLGLAK
jgi:ribonuclease P protein component